MNKNKMIVVTRVNVWNQKIPTAVIASKIIKVEDTLAGNSFILINDGTKEPLGFNIAESVQEVVSMVNSL